MENSKNWYQSATIMVNLCALLVLILSETAIINIIPQTAMPYVLAVVALLNVFIRYFRTTEPITKIMKPDDE